MKNKIFIIVCLITLLVITGCSNNTQNLTCTATENANGMETSSKLEIKVKDDEVKNIRLTMNITFSEGQEMYKQAMISQLSQKTNQIYSTTDGIKAIFGMDSVFFKELGLSKNASYGELKQVLILQGYTCDE